ncbi:hypothetical protein WR25_11489 [Diploscapter pachys]|uniref:VTT domain-containing protein n=1 Tax=Diploscapter pachys TaxID=2018661 RepID=A0A2A2JPY4_9BILA|nr:hypothetical protein WR25_11489 [Diploscapter pachys]
MSSKAARSQNGKNAVVDEIQPEKSESRQKGESQEQSNRMYILPLIFAGFISCLLLVFLTFPEVSESDRSQLKLPRNIEDAKVLGRILSKYKNDNFYSVLLAVISVYITLQSFAIPGSIFLTILSGYLFPFPVAILLVCTCSAVGAAVCYLLSHLFGRQFVIRRFPDRIAYWQSQVAAHRDHLLNYIIFLRVTPILPNWSINILSPVLDVPLSPFFWGTFLGVAPPSFLYIQAGVTLEQMTQTNVVWNWQSIFLLTFFAVISLLPIYFKRKAKSE